MTLQQSSASLVVVEPRQLPSMTSLEQAQILTAKEATKENGSKKAKQLGLPKPNSSATSIDLVSSGVSSSTAAQYAK